MSTTDHPDHTNHVAPQCPAPGLDPISVLRDAVAIIATLDHTSTAEATGHPHTGTHPALGTVQRCAPPLHQRQHPPHQVPERVWAIVLAAAAPTRPTPIPPPPNPTGRTPGRTLKVTGRWQ